MKSGCRVCFTSHPNWPEGGQDGKAGPSGQIRCRGCLAVTISAGIHAQWPARLVADIPFDFQIGKATLPPGQYIFNFGFLNSGPLSIQSRDGSRNAIALTSAVAPSTNSGTAKMVFNRYGSDYFLSQVWNPDESIIRGLSI